MPYNNGDIYDAAGHKIGEIRPSSDPDGCVPLIVVGLLIVGGLVGVSILGFNMLRYGAPSPALATETAVAGLCNGGQGTPPPLTADDVIQDFWTFHDNNGSITIDKVRIVPTGKCTSTAYVTFTSPDSSNGAAAEVQCASATFTYDFYDGAGVHWFDEGDGLDGGQLGAC